ncbi:MAG: GNVR domain-containing protein [Candidatus Eisenbacteria bacterium]
MSVETLGEIKGQIVAKEVQRDVLRRTRARDAYELQRVDTELEALQEQYEALVRGTPGADAGVATRDLTVPLDELPDLAAELLRRQKEVQLQHTVYELLTQQYYHALLEEARDTPTVSLLDEAIPPLGKSSPKRKMIVLVAGMAGVVLGSVWVLVTDRPRRIEAMPRAAAARR